MALRIGIGKNLRITPSGTVLIYEPEIVSYIAGLITPLSASHLIRLNQLIIDIKLAVGATTLSDVFDLLYILAGETRESSLRNFINQIFNGVEVGTNTYTQFEGFISDGVTGYIATSFNPTMSGVRFKRDDAGNGLYSRTAKAFDTNQQGGALATINALRTALTARFRLNNATNYEISVTSSIGFTAWYRSNATNAWGVKNKTHTAPTATPSTGTDNIGIRILGTQAPYYDKIQTSLYYMSKCLTAIQHDAFVDAFEAYMDSNGKGVIT